MNPRSEFYQALYESGHSAAQAFSYETLAAVALLICLVVFAVASVLAWRRPAASFAREALIPFETQPETEDQP